MCTSIAPLSHTLIDLGAAINVMTKDTMLKINLQASLRKTTTILKLADHSIVTPRGNSGGCDGLH